jgi:hypothetical protein
MLDQLLGLEEEGVVEILSQRVADQEVGREAREGQKGTEDGDLKPGEPGLQAVPAALLFEAHGSSPPRKV